MVHPLAQAALWLKLLDEHKLWLTPAECAEQVTQFRERNHLTDAAQFEQWLTKKRLSLEHFSAQLAFIASQQRLKEKIVPPADIELAFINKKAQLDTIVFIVIAVPTMAEALQLAQRLEAGEDMLRLATALSQHPSAADGGLVGPLPWSKLAPQLRQHLQHQPMGQLIPPFYSDAHDKVLLLRPVRHYQAELNQTLYNQCLDELFQQWLHRQVVLAEPTLCATPISLAKVAS
jgi:hypothetical protein